MLPPEQPTAEASCPEYGKWELPHEQLRYEDDWIVQYPHYSRTIEDEYCGASKEQEKAEGPFRFRPATSAWRLHLCDSLAAFLCRLCQLGSELRRVSLCHSLHPHSISTPNVRVSTETGQLQFQPYLLS